MTALVAAVCVPIWVHVVDRGVPAPVMGLLPWQLATIAVGLTAVFAWCELVPLRLEFRSQTVMLGLFEFPLLIGLLVAPWWVVLGAQLLGTLIVYLVRKDSLQHSLLNTVNVLADFGLALTVMIVLSDLTGELPTTPILVACGVFVGSFASTAVICLVVQLIGTTESVLTMLGRASASAAFVIVFALAEYVLWRQPTLGPALAVAMIVVFALIYVMFRSMMRRHATLNQLYTFIRAVGETQADNSRWPELMEMVRGQNNASVAVVYLENAEEFIDTSIPTRLLTLAVDSDGEVRVPSIEMNDYLLQLAAAQGTARASIDKDTDEQILDSLRSRDAKAVMVIALTVSGRVRGFVEVRDPLSRWGQFTAEDAAFLSTLGMHMGTALENQQLLGSLRNEAYRDSITGLRSRAGFVVDAEPALAKHQVGAVVLIDLDTLSQVNNALGHRHGEELLVQVGQRINSVGGHRRVVARLESDLFAVLMEPCSEADLTADVQAMLAALSPAFSLAGVEVTAEPRAGIAVAAGETNGQPPDAASLLQRAEMALLASQSRHERYEIFRPAMGEVYRRRFQLVTQFRQAIEHGHIVVHYQPKVSLRDQRLCGVEALVRWVHPEFGMVTPSEFIKAIEATGSIDILLDHVLSIVLKQIRQWLDRNLEIQVAVNLSVRNLTAKQFPQRVAAELAKHRVPARLLTFELTESNVMNDPETALPILDELHAMGLSLAVDDFGTGYSSLAYLRRLPIDEIKIDRSFVLGMSTALGDLAIVQSIIDLGHSLGLQVIAEGVEEEASREALRSMRCDGIQGFLISRPQPAERFEAWLAARTARGTQPDSTPIMRAIG